MQVEILKPFRDKYTKAMYSAAAGKNVVSMKKARYEEIREKLGEGYVKECAKQSKENGGTNDASDVG